MSEPATENQNKSKQQSLILFFLNICIKYIYKNRSSLCHHFRDLCCMTEWGANKIVAQCNAVNYLVILAVLNMDI